MKSKLLTIIILLNICFFAPQNIKAQNFLSFANDNYSGATGMFYQPASIADSRYKFDMEFMGASTRVENNWWGIDRAVLFNFNAFQDSNFSDKYLSPVDNDDPKFVNQAIEARVLSFMVSLSPKSAFGFSVRVRQMINFDNLNADAANLILEKNNIPELFNTDLKYEDMSQQAVAWAEYGFTYSQVVYDQNKHFLKVGVTGKLLQGMGAIYLYERELSYTLNNQDTAMNVYGDVRMGASSNFEDLIDYKFTAKPGIGMDFGFVYEFRPKHEKYLYDMDGKKDIQRRDKNKYLLRVGFSVLDLGSMTFKKEFGANDFIINTDTFVLGELDITNISDLAQRIDTNGNIVGTDDFFKYRLPTTLNLNVDYRVMDHFYVNLNGRYALNQGNQHFSKAHYLNAVSLTPRYEGKWFGASLPLRLNQFNQFNVGLGLRLGFLWIGSNNLLALTGLQESIMSADVYMAVKIPIMYDEPKDADLDLVSDSKDDCPFDKGLLELNGCPDSDGDGIANKLDECAYTFGLAEFNGCPDTDGDGVQDKFDDCPEIAGSKLYAGCPDTDEDGIIDKNDSCPSLAGTLNYFGCPDTDGDSIPDNLDDCPELAGIIAFNGCPDTDGDGIMDALDLCPQEFGLDSLQGCPYVDTDNDSIQDKYDKCPKIAGPRENSGCPYADTDGDGVPDKDDFCPLTPGPIANNGCPILEKEEEEILKTAFNNLEFKTSKSIILASSYSSLDELAALMKKKSTFRLLIEGYTDNVGSPNANMSLSQNRASAVKKYLEKKGVESSRIDTKWYGEDKPIADNKTAEGRAKNRRVEMEVIFD